MDLPIDDKELDMIVWMLEHLSGDGAEELHKKLKLVKEVRDCLLYTSPSPRD